MLYYNTVHNIILKYIIYYNTNVTLYYKAVVQYTLVPPPHSVIKMFTKGWTQQPVNIEKSSGVKMIVLINVVE